MTAKNTVFIVDDDELITETLHTVFFLAGFQVYTYTSAKVFIHDYKEVNQSCLLLDLNMPEFSGLELQAWLCEQKIQVPIVFLSGAADLDSAVKAMSDGAFTFLQKPVDNKKLVATVQAAIEKAASREQSAAPIYAAKTALASLSLREKEIAVLISEGYSASTIAEQLCISVRTVEAHKANVFTKLNLNSIAQLTKLVVLSTQATSNT